MKDLLGAEVTLGDTVVIAQPKGYQSLVISTVTEVDVEGSYIKVKGNANKKYSCIKVSPPSIKQEETVTLTLQKYTELYTDASHLNQLKNAGVDNWSEYFSYRDLSCQCSECGGYLEDGCDCNE